jgi:hypothetical protein
MQLGADLALAWSHPAVTSATRKRILRAALHEIIVRVEDDHIGMVLHWQGGDVGVACKQIPYAAEQGMFFGVTGNFYEGTGNFSGTTAMIVARPIAARTGTQQYPHTLNHLGNSQPDQGSPIWRRSESQSPRSYHRLICLRGRAAFRSSMTTCGWGCRLAILQWSTSAAVREYFRDERTVGPVTADKMNRLGIFTGADLRRQSLAFLQQQASISTWMILRVSAGGTLANVSANAVVLFRNIKRLKLDVAQHVPIHGNPGSKPDFERIVGPVAARAPQAGGGG